MDGPAARETYAACGAIFAKVKRFQMRSSQISHFIGRSLKPVKTDSTRRYCPVIDFE